MLEAFTHFVRRHTQFIRFVIAGSFALAVNLVALYTLTDIFGVYYLISTVLAFLVALSVSFMLQKFWTFQDHSHDRLHAQIPIYAVMQTTNVTLNAALMYLFVEYLHIRYLFSQVLISLGLAAIVFFINRTYIFKPRTP